jgi:hypothetical protein
VQIVGYANSRYSRFGSVLGYFLLGKHRILRFGQYYRWRLFYFGLFED